MRERCKTDNIQTEYLLNRQATFMSNYFAVRRFQDFTGSIFNKKKTLSIILGKQI